MACLHTIAYLTHFFLFLTSPSLSPTCPLLLLPKQHHSSSSSLHLPSPLLPSPPPTSTSLTSAPAPGSLPCCALSLPSVSASSCYGFPNYVGGGGGVRCVCTVKVCGRCCMGVWQMVQHPPPSFHPCDSTPDCPHPTSAPPSTSAGPQSGPAEHQVPEHWRW